MDIMRFRLAVLYINVPLIENYQFPPTPIHPLALLDYKCNYMY